MENQIELMGYITKNFDISSGAYEAFSYLREILLDMSKESRDDVLSAIKYQDAMLGLVKTLPDLEDSSDQIEEIIMLSHMVTYMIGKIAVEMDLELISMFDYLTVHIKDLSVVENDNEEDSSEADNSEENSMVGAMYELSKSNKTKELDAPPSTLEEAKLELMSEDIVGGCPLPMTDKQTNIDNHLVVVKQANLGPPSPSNPGDYWIKMAAFWNTTEKDAKSRLCKNCGYYMNTKQIKGCWDANKEVGNIPIETEINPAWEVVGNPAGFCLRWDITCTPTRTCLTWAPGGPIIDN